MSAYAAATPAVHPEEHQPVETAPARRPASPAPVLRRGDVEAESAVDGLLDLLANRIADAVTARLDPGGPQHRTAEWLDTREAASYLGVHRDTLRRFASERAIPFEQDGPGCKLFFLRDDLDAWRRGGGRSAALAAVA